MTTNACGTCTACCRVYAIPDLNKPAGKWCEHCAIGKGCKIYETRPQLCVDFKCLWLQSQEREPSERLEPALRPDRCKVVFSPVANEDMSTDPNLMAAVTMPGAPSAWRSGAARELIDRMIAGGIDVIVGLPASRQKIRVSKFGERVVEMSEPDENGMQWSLNDATQQRKR